MNTAPDNPIPPDVVVDDDLLIGNLGFKKV
jgi:hypothetical protein